MSNVQIPNLPVAIALNGTEALEAVQSGTSVQTTVAGIAQYSYAYYPGFYISQLPAASSVNSTDIFPVVQGSTGPNTGTTRKMTVAQLFTSPALTGTTTIGSNLANYLTVTGGATSGSDGTATISTLGSATNSHMTLSTKGTNSFVRVNRRVLHSTTSNLDTLGGLVAADMVFRMQTAYTYASTAMASHWAVNGTVAGTITSAGGVNSFASFGLTSQASGGTQSLYVQNTISTGATAGNFGAISGQIFASIDVSIGNAYFLTGNSGGTTTSASLGGSYGTTGGNIFGFNYYARALAGSKHINSVVGGEINVTADTDVEVYQKIGLQVVIQPNMSTFGMESRAWRTNNAIAVGAGLSYVGMPGFDIAFALSGSSDGWPMARTWGKVMGLSPFTYTTTPSVGFGIDFDGITINSLAWRSNGCTLSGAGVFGAVTTGGDTLQTRLGIVAKTATLASVTVLHGGLYTTIPTLSITGTGTVTVATMEGGRAAAWTPGTSYTAGDILTVAGGTYTTPTTYTVVTVDASGRPRQLKLTALGNYTVLPANPVSFTGGSGTGTTATLWWAIRTLSTTPGSGYPEAPVPVITSVTTPQADPVLLAVMTATETQLVLNTTSNTKVVALAVGANQVVAARQTGWAAPTGAATRTTFDTATVTTAQLAERVKALIDNLTTHGLIGA